MSDTTAAGIAGTVSQVDEAVMAALPFVSTFIGFIPGGAAAVPFMPLAGKLLQGLDDACKAVANGKPGASPQEVLEEVISHNTPGMPNSPILSG